MIEIRDATPDEIRGLLGFVPGGIKLAITAIKDGKPIGLCGVIRDPAYVGSILEDEGRWIGFFQLNELPDNFGFRAIMVMAKRMRELRLPIWVQCDTVYPTAEKLCRALGFQPTDEFCAAWRDPKRKLRMWKWQRSA